MNVIPAIDIQNGKCVRLVRGGFSFSTIYNHNPIQQAEVFLDSGFNFLHIIDLDGAETGKQRNLDIIKELLKLKGLLLQVGGGIRSIYEVEELLRLGAERVIVGTAIFSLPSFIEDLQNNFSSEQIVLGLDFKVMNKKPIILTHGWNQSSEIGLFEFLEKENYFNRILATDISLDGVLEGPNTNIYEMLIQKFQSINLIASGGVSSLDDLKDLRSLSVKEVIVGKAIYENRISLSDLKNVN